jgi:pimeloyl-ACP methyl ester carboxylesterase
MSTAIEPVVGRYLHLDHAGRRYRIYFESAGGGIPLVCLHTAGSDGRQYRGLINAAAVTARFRVIAFDMPWHGKSSPPEGWQDEEYRLTADAYTGLVMAFIDALGLDRPVVMGCSIGGRVVLHLALRHPRAFRALIGLESWPMSSPITTPAGCIAPMCMAARSRPARCRGWSRRRRRRPIAGRRCGITCKAGPASSKAISISTASTAMSAARSAISIPRNARSTC